MSDGKEKQLICDRCLSLALNHVYHDCFVIGETGTNACDIRLKYNLFLTAIALICVVTQS